MTKQTNAMREVARAAVGEKWTEHVTSSGVHIEIYDDNGEVAIRGNGRNTLLLTETQWRELAQYAIAKFEAAQPAVS